ncbi:Uncharacterised protein [Streptococcus pneumoniae]|nr:Uncharacterised protein [Streptococcus pneumoniae]
MLIFLKTGSFNKRKSNIGCFTFSSTIINNVMNTTPAIPVLIISGEIHPFDGPWLSAYMSIANPGADKIKPSESKRPADFSTCSAKNRSPNSNATIPKGRLI